MQRGKTVGLDQRSTFAMIVVQPARSRRQKQAPKMVEAMTIVSTDRGVERRRTPAGEMVVAQFREQGFTLKQGLDDRFDQLAFGNGWTCVHDLLLFSYLCKVGSCETRRPYKLFTLFLDQARPVRFGLLQVAFDVLVEILAD